MFVKHWLRLCRVDSGNLKVGVNAMQVLTSRWLQLFTLHFFLILSMGQVWASSLPDWQQGKNKSDIISFVQQVTSPNSKYYVPINKRVAVFDLDGTLVSEQPVSAELSFSISHINAKTGTLPLLVRSTLFSTCYDIEVKRCRDYVLKHYYPITISAHSGLTENIFDKEVSDWLKVSKNPTTSKLYSHSVYEPMKEIINFLKSKKFSIYIVTGSGTDFARLYANKVFGLAPSHVIGSQYKKQLEAHDGMTQIVYQNKMLSENGGDNKVLNINSHIGIRPIIAFGNSDDDMSMLKWTEEGTGPHLSVLIHHTDKAREWQYDKNSPVGELDKGLNYGAKHHWLIVDMKKDWKTIY